MTNNNSEGRRRALEAALRAVEGKGNTSLASAIRRALQELAEASQGGA